MAKVPMDMICGMAQNRNTSGCCSRCMYSMQAGRWRIASRTCKQVGCLRGSVQRWEQLASLHSNEKAWLECKQRVQRASSALAIDTLAAAGRSQATHHVVEAAHGVLTVDWVFEGVQRLGVAPPDFPRPPHARHRLLVDVLLQWCRGSAAKRQLMNAAVQPGLLGDTNRATAAALCRQPTHQRWPAIAPAGETWQLMRAAADAAAQSAVQVVQQGCA